jgi:hypothetical protein
MKSNGSGVPISKRYTTTAWYPPGLRNEGPSSELSPAQWINANLDESPYDEDDVPHTPTEVVARVF